MSKEYLTAQEVTERLGISRSTLYAYVSRGLIRSEALGDGREKRYHAEDVEHLASRKLGLRAPQHIAQDAMHWGTPILDSSLTLIKDGALYYRGQPATQLARTATFEEVAALLWLGDPAQADDLFSEPVDGIKYETILLHAAVDGADPPPIQAMQAVLPLAMLDDPAAYDLQPPTLFRAGARIVRLLALLFAGESLAEGPIVQGLAQAVCPEQPAASALLSAALILCADHELNASSFTARVVASVHSNPYAVVQAGLSALQGARHGGYAGRVEALLADIAQPERINDILRAWMQRGDAIPGFGHRLYPAGDPRVGTIMALLAEYMPDSPALAQAQALISATYRINATHPTIDLALVTLTRALGLPAGSALALFAIGRAVGWIAHASEQYTNPMLIRPRARYTGPKPGR